MNIIIFLIVLSVLVFVHELGHFLFAKMTNTKVHSFAIGFQPTLFKKKIGETTYKFNLIPFGGYVRIHGQEDPALVTEDRDRAFFAKPLWAKLGILLGGILFNLIFAWMLISATLMIGTPAIATDANRAELVDVSNRILVVQPGSAAAEAGLSAGMNVASVTSQEVTVAEPNTDQLIEIVAANSGTELDFEIISESGEVTTVSVIPQATIGSDRPLLGLSVESIGDRKLSFGKALSSSLTDTRTMTRDTVASFASLIRDAVGGKADVSTLTGPVGLVGVVGDAASFGISYLLFFTALISINLAVLNLIPFPALDGGQVLFTLIEAIMRKPIKPKIAGIINIIGFGSLILLMVSVTVFDIVKLL